jgi:hypothetical protein
MRRTTMRGKKALMYDYDDQVDGDGVCDELVVR